MQIQAGNLDMKIVNRKLANLNAGNVHLELNVRLLHVVRPGCEQTLTHVLVKVTCNKHAPVIDAFSATCRKALNAEMTSNFKIRPKKLCENQKATQYFFSTQNCCDNIVTLQH